jgi:hypothetical protein
VVEITDGDRKLAYRICAEARGWEILPQEVAEMIAEDRERCEQAARDETLGTICDLREMVRDYQEKSVLREKYVSFLEATLRST